MLQEKGSSGAFSNIYLWIAVIFFFNFKLYQTMINQTKVKIMLKTISRRLKFLNLIKLGTF